MNDALNFLLNITFDFVSIIFIARFWLQLVGVNTSNQISRFVLRFTQPWLNLLRFIPTVKRVNLAVLVALLLLNLGLIGLMYILSGARFSLDLIFILAVSNLASQILDFMFWSIIIQVVFSWLPNAGFHPLAQVVYKINAPMLRPLQRFIPPLGGFDLSPVAAIIIIEFIKILFLGR
jgi:YggT family protein